MTGRYPDLLSMWQYLHLLSFTGLPPELSSSVVSGRAIMRVAGPMSGDGLRAQQKT